jgi:hypothetical protein
MSTTEILNNVLLGGVLGVIGQGLRTITGLKKWYDDRKHNADQADEFDIKRMVVSLFIGFVAGALGLLFFDTQWTGEKKDIAAIIGIGYAGVDFIEGFITKYAPKTAPETEVSALHTQVNINPALAEG